MKHIVFFMSAADIRDEYAVPSLRLIERMVKAGYGFIFGGSQTGMMKRASDEAKKHGGVVTAVTCKLFLDVCIRDSDFLHVVEDIPDRKRMLVQKSNAVVALPGGSGTLDEITDAIEAKKFGVFTGPIVLLNIHGFWNGLIDQYEYMFRNGFMTTKPSSIYTAIDTPEQAALFLSDELGSN